MDPPGRSSASGNSHERYGGRGRGGRRDRNADRRKARDEPVASGPKLVNPDAPKNFPA